MKNLFNIFKKEHEPNRGFDWNDWFNTQKSYVYVPQRLSAEDVLVSVKQGLMNYFGAEEVQEIPLEQAVVFMVKDSGKLKSLIKLDGVYHLYVQPQQGHWAFALAASEWVEGTNSMENWPEPHDISSISGISQSALIEKIEAEIVALLPQHYPAMQDGGKDHRQAYIHPAGRYVESTKNAHWLWQLSFLSIDEPLIVWLGISTLKKAPSQEKLDALKDHDLYYWTTDRRKGIVGFSKNTHRAQIVDLSEEVLEVKSVVGRDEAKQGAWEWLTNLSNDLQYVEAQDFINRPDSAARLRECARLNWLKDTKDKPSDDYAFSLIRRLASIGSYPFDDLALLCMSLTDKKRQVIIHKENTNEELLHQIHQALTKHGEEKDLPQWVESWQISPESASSILSAFLALREDTSKHLLPLHQWVREQFLKNQKKLKKYDKWEKPLLQRLNFEFEYLQHLISCENYEEALALAEELFACLPDETPQDLIADLELEETTRKQTYRIQLLDFIVQARNGSAEALKELRHLACLEPLRAPRLKALSAGASGVLKERVEACIDMLSNGQFITSPYPITQLPKAPLKSESAEQVKSLISSGILSKMQSWVAAVRLPDLSQVRSYNELITSGNDRTHLLKKVASIQMLLKMTPVDCYITRGEKAGEMRAYGGLDAFMLVGHHLIDTTGPRYAGDAEQVFLLASEMAHIKFKHAKITSSDVWRGSLEKGFMAAQFLPMLGTAFKAFSIPSIKVPVSPIMDRGSQAMQKIEDMGLLDYAKEHMDSYMSQDPEEANDNEKLLEVSQFMQFVADRIGLIACGNIQAAVRAMFHNSDQYYKNTTFVAEFGLKRLAQQEDEEGQAAYRLLNLRIASLISFYLSKHYSQARREAMDGLDV